VLAKAKHAHADIAEATMTQSYYKAGNFEPGKSLGYLIKRCGTLMTGLAADAFVSQPLSFTQWTVLMKLRHFTHLSATELGESVGHDLGALTRVVDSLERAGFVERERGRRDRRTVEIALTPQGLQQVEDSTHLVVGLLNELLEPFSRSDFESLIAQLQRLRERLQEYSDRQVAQGAVAVPAPAARKTGGPRSHAAVSRGPRRKSARAGP
jgi:DNA-binding MarR family transcriptional regulator